MQKVENYEHFVRKQDVTVEMIDNHTANKIVTDHHYLRRPVYIGRNVSYGIQHKAIEGMGVVMYGYPVFHTKQWLVGSEEPLRNGELVDLQRVWMPDGFPPGTESLAISKSIHLLRSDWPKIHRDNTRRFIPRVKAIITMADEEFMHDGTLYRASNLKYLGMTRGRKAAVGCGHGRWSGAKKANVGQKAGSGKHVFILVLDSSVEIDIEALRNTYINKKDGR